MGFDCNDYGSPAKPLSSPISKSYAAAVEFSFQGVFSHAPADFHRKVFQIVDREAFEDALRPTAHIAIRDGHEIPNPDDKYNWGGASVRNILDKPEYMGNTVNFRTYKDSYKDKKSSAVRRKNGSSSRIPSRI